MWDEQINKKIKDSADQYHPAYDDNAWGKMEQMLDEHLPQKKDRRRIIYYFLPLILLLAGIIFFMIPPKKPILTSKNSENLSFKSAPKSKYEPPKSKSAEVANSGSPKSAGNLATNVKEGNILSKETSLHDADHGAKKIDKLSIPGNVDITNVNTRLTSQKSLTDNQGKQSQDKPLSVAANTKGNPSLENNAGESTYQTSNEEIAPATKAYNNNPLQNVGTATTKDDKKVVTPPDNAKVENPKNANSNINQKKPKGFVKNFGIGLSAGPDVSAVRLSQTGKVTLSYGAELNYSFSNKFTLRTGFYIAKKIYSVGEDDYHIPPGYASANSAYLESVDANCKVYEIPLMLSYNFGKVKKHNWFASAGLSSYLMKKESYIYLYKYPWGTTGNWPWTVKNKNKHYFSVLDISAGYKYFVSNRFSLIAEPYVKLPLSGIGAGKIKLNSAGVLFTVAVKPF